MSFRHSSLSFNVSLSPFSAPSAHLMPPHCPLNNAFKSPFNASPSTFSTFPSSFNDNLTMSPFNSHNFITNLYSMDKYNIVDLSFMNTIIDVNSPISADMMSAGAINDVLCMRDQKNTNLTSDELNQLVSFFCLDN